MFKFLMVEYFGISSVTELLDGMGLEPLTISEWYYQLLQIKK